MSTLLSLAKLSKSFQKEDDSSFLALKELNLDISDEHHLISLIGPDGSGKSTLLKIIAGLMAPNEGTMSLFLPSSENSNSQIGYMSQNLGLYEDLSVGVNLKLFCQLRDFNVSTLGTRSAVCAVDSVTKPCSWWSSLFNNKDKDAKERALDQYLDNLLTQVGLIKFKDYKAGSLSGGMKQKLALTCAISARPQLLLLDEPTVGVDPISRRELWEIIKNYLKSTGSYCIFSSLYLEEAEQGSLTLFIKNGELIYQGSAQKLKDEVQQQCFALSLDHKLSYQQIARTMMCNLNHSQHIIDLCPRMGRIDILTQGKVSMLALEHDIYSLLEHSPFANLSASDFSLTAREPILEDAYINLTYESSKNHAQRDKDSASISESSSTLEDAESYELERDETGQDVVIKVDGIKKQFGNFTAVHDSNFKVYKGEIFGLLGPNGAGKTTTFRMICSLLNPSYGTILMNNMELKNAKSSVRATIGYVAQKFCLYRKLTAQQNLEYFGQSYGLIGKTLHERIQAIAKVFGLTPFLNDISATLPFGIQRSLSMACALIHRPTILFLDEATSGADPTSRRSFWSMIAKLSAQGTTVIVTTHFMEEAEYCDRFLIQDQGKILILGTPDEICEHANGRISIEEAFVNCVMERRARKS